MFNFSYYTPTQVVVGRDAEARTGALVKAQGCKKVLIHYGGGSVVRSGLLDRIKASLDKEGVAYIELGGVVPNPRLSLVYQGIELCKKEGVDFILAVGGGSVIDSSKAIAYGLAEDADVWELYDRARQARACLPVGVVLTIAAAGSEMSNSSVITKDEGGVKRGYNNDICRPKFAHPGAVLHPQRHHGAHRQPGRGPDAHGDEQRENPPGRPQELRRPGGGHVGQQPVPQRAYRLRQRRRRLGPPRSGARDGRHV